ncbi:F-box domain containing protein [Teratosphaeria destructans]|uniref:F-box domain containing protein n=1 Tax=Teratosphaeria destructans TaxID=418781 RepID=A0A9W7W1C5_9PEZI|nr:F-box domain containing protein [Teratosphaeria destructans]
MERDTQGDAHSPGSDFYNDASTNAPTADHPSASGVPAPTELTPDRSESLVHAEALSDVDDGDSSVDMDVSEPSRSPTPEPAYEGCALPGQPEQPGEAVDSAVHAGAKRKLSDAIDPLDALEQSLEDNSKKPRWLESPNSAPDARPSPAERCPVQLWQQVFLRLSPAVLSRCLCVSKTFNRYLTTTKADPTISKKDAKKIRILDSDTIWAEARKAYFPNMPRPLLQHTELQMLQLIGSKHCQFCGRVPLPVLASNPYNAGPGPDGLRVIWPFRIRACGPCFEQRTIKDVDFMVITSVNLLRLGLPHAFRTPDLHFVPDIQRHLPGGIPQHSGISKVYYQPDVDAIAAEFEDVKGYGNGAAEEWRKGLDTKGRERMADASRWEKWESQIGFGADLAQVLREYDLPSFPRHVEGTQSKAAGVSPPITNPPFMANGPHALPQPVHVFPKGFTPTFGTSTTTGHLTPRTLRNAHNIEEARAARKSEIERRCLELEPPLEPKVLPFMDSFNAAMQITTPMNDAQWEMLKPRLLSQREAAELMVHKRAEQLAALEAAIPATVHDDSFTKPAREVYDQKYEDAQEPLRQRLGEYAEDYITIHWSGGQNLDGNSAPLFAVGALQHVWDRYLEDKQADNLPVHGQIANLSLDQGSPAPEPFLSLDNMKWVFDNKIRGLVGPHYQHLFICANCEEERNPKWFAFESLIQHYGAKHTTAFSQGNIVVHWQTAQWPDKPPFHLKPEKWIKAARRMAEYRPYARARNTLQQRTVRDVPHMPAASSVLLSDNPLFSSGAQQSSASNGYFAGPPHGQPPMPWVPQRNSSYAAEPPQQTKHMSYDAQLYKLATDAREVWDTLASTADLLECIRMQTVLYHVTVRFQERFYQKPTLDLLTDALATNSSMRPLKNAHGLACKICVASQTDGSAEYQSYYARIRNVKLYHIASLVTHFKIAHQPQEVMSHLDWSRDMIELPETQLISDVIRTPGMDDEKLKLVAQAFPTAFSSPLPKIGTVTEQSADVRSDSGLANRLLSRLNKDKQKPSKKKRNQTNGVSGRDISEDAVIPPAEDEYDPRRPVYAQDQVVDPARFDTDLARKPSGTASLSAASAPSVGLTPEALAALNNLTAVKPQQQEPDGFDRSPSVGRAEPMPAKPAFAPDISAILATLTGKLPAQTATPPATVDNRSGSAPQFPPTQTPYAVPQTSPASYRPESRRSSGRQERGYYAAPEPSPRHDPVDLRAALVRNSIHFEQNQHARAQTQTSFYTAPSAPRSPPRYREVDEGSQPYYQQPYPPAHNPLAFSYVQMQPQHGQQAPVQYHYEPQPAYKPLYVDKYGRQVELIPIDSAPAPVQYVPHPHEQQQHQYGQPQQSAYAAQQPSLYQHGYGQPVYYEQTPQPRYG